MHKIVCITAVFYIFIPSANAAENAAMSLSLDQAILKSMQNNPKIRKSDQEIAVAEHQLASTRSSFLPTMALEISAGTARDREQFTDEVQRPEFNRDHNFYNGDFVATLNLFKGFSQQREKTMRQKKKNLSEVERNDLKASIRRDVLLSYFEVQLIRKKIAAEKEAKVLRRKQLTEVQNRNRAGAATKLDVLQAKYAFQNTDPEIKKLENVLQRATLRLSQLMGDDFSKELKLTDGLEKAFYSTKDIKTPTLGELYKTALNRHYNLQRLEHEKERLHAELNSQQSKHWPRLDLEFRASSRAFFREEIFDEEVRRHQTALVLSVPIFSGLSSFSDRAAIHDKIVSAEIDKKIAREELLANLTDYFQRRELSYEELKSEQTNLQLADESIKQSRNLYDAGSAKLTDVLDAYTQKFNAIKNLGQAMYNHIEATAWLQYYTSGHAREGK